MDMDANGASGRILVGVDGSEDGLRAVRYAMRHARASGASLWLVHVVDERLLAAGLWELVADPEALRRSGQRSLDEAEEILAAEDFPAARITAEVILGDPAAELGRLTAEAGLVVLGRRATSGLERMFVGSTSVEAVSRAHCPVIVISAASTPHQTGRLHVVAVAGTVWPPSSTCLDWGVDEAEARKARLRVVRIIAGSLASAPALVPEATVNLDHHLGPLRDAHPQLPIDAEVISGNPIDELVDISRVVDLLILDVPPEPAPLSGLARGVMAHAMCPVGVWRRPASQPGAAS